MPNRLAYETSPYLLQHRDNPVDWYPWCVEALDCAKREDKPILLSIGYSACHWCHVMERESFEDFEIARLMNENFINIKVDREERPDLDQIYQNVAQAMTKSGGWPLTVFLTPDLKPFFGGTYFPPEDRYGRPGFPRILRALSDAYRNDQRAIHQNASKLMEYIQALEALPPVEGEVPTLSALEEAADGILEEVDLENGGLRGAPKFPQASLFSFLWRIGLAKGRDDLKSAVVLSLLKMARGGIYDQIGGGFHRYSVDEAWCVPHFEKMLYDNGLFLKLYSEVFLTAGESLSGGQRELLLSVIQGTVDYVLREMRSTQGLFYSSQDADSEGEEGRFFAWDLMDLSRLLSIDEARIVARHYGVTEGGNFERGKTILRQAEVVSSPVERRVLATAKEKLLQHRQTRAAPGTDRKILCGWNALMISGLTWASKVLHSKEREAARVAARQAFEALDRFLSLPGGRLFSTLQSREGERQEAKHSAYLDDYAFLAMAALDLARSEEDPDHQAHLLTRGEAWLDVIMTHFRDKDGFGYYFTSDDHEALIQRPKTLSDQALPSGVAVSLCAMMALSEMDWNGQGGKFSREVESQLPALFAIAKRSVLGCGELLSSSLLNVLGPVVVAGESAFELCRHPHIFQKPVETRTRPGELLVCHRKTCRSMDADQPEAWEEVSRKTLA